MGEGQEVKTHRREKEEKIVKVSKEAPE